MANYVLDDNNNKIPAYSQEEVLAVLNQAIADGTLEGIIQTAFINAIKCCVSGETNKMAFVTQEKYNELAANDALVTNCYYFITDDTTAEDQAALLETLNQSLVAITNGTSAVPKASHLETYKTTVNGTSTTITRAGLYVADVILDGYDSHYTVVLDIEDLSVNYYSSAFGFMYLNNTGTTFNINYDATNKTINSASGITIISIRLVTAY